MNTDHAKRLAARAAIAELPDSGTIGLGSGSTAKLFIDEVGALVKSGRKLVGVPTSEASLAQATSLGIPLLADEGPWDIAVAVDGADEVDESLNLIKGGGGAHTREKIVNYASRRNVIIVDETKLSRRLGEKWPVPVEVVPFGHEQTARRLGELGRPVLRQKAGAVFRTDAGNVIYDVHAGVLSDPASLDSALRSIPGVVETGLFIGRTDVLPDRGRGRREAAASLISPFPRRSPHLVSPPSRMPNAFHALSLAFLALSSCHSARPSASGVGAAGLVADRFRVHVDHVAPTRTSQFELARRKLLAEYRFHGVTEGPTFVLETEEPAYLSLRPFDRYSDLDRIVLQQAALDEAIGADMLAKLDERTHATLVPPHANEIWSYRGAMSYAPTGLAVLASASVGRLVEHQVMPADDDEYAKAVEEETLALRKSGHPVSRLLFFSAYGSGRYETLWLADERASLDLPLPGEAASAETKARTRAQRELVHNVVVRRDLGTP